MRQVYSLGFSPDGKKLAGGGIQNLVIWDLAGGAQRVYPTESLGAVHVRFSPDGKKVTTVQGFHGHIDEAGNNLLVYPRVREWDVTPLP